jgi:hypothetical protein
MLNAKQQCVRWALGACLTIGLALAVAPASHAQTADGVTPAVEDICTKWGMTGQVNGLCNAYCEAMDCDAAEPQASEQACARVLGKIEAALGDTPFPTCEDTDDDGVPNGIDNCPNVANADQADAKPATPEGDACEPVVCPCWDAAALTEMVNTCAARSNDLSCSRGGGETLARCPAGGSQFYIADVSIAFGGTCVLIDHADGNPTIVATGVTAAQQQVCNDLVTEVIAVGQCQ